MVITHRLNNREQAGSGRHTDQYSFCAGTEVVLQCADHGHDQRCESQNYIKSHTHIALLSYLIEEQRNDTRLSNARLGSRNRLGRTTIAHLRVPSRSEAILAALTLGAECSFSQRLDSSIPQTKHIFVEPHPADWVLNAIELFPRCRPHAVPNVCPRRPV